MIAITVNFMMFPRLNLGVGARRIFLTRLSGLGCFFVQPAPRQPKELLPAHCRGLRRCKTFQQNHRRRPHSRLTVCLLYSTSWVFFSGGICLRLFDVFADQAVYGFGKGKIFFFADGEHNGFIQVVINPRRFGDKAFAPSFGVVFFAIAFILVGFGNFCRKLQAPLFVGLVVFALLVVQVFLILFPLLRRVFLRVVACHSPVWG
nr:MAG TPA: hypothetical protein [Caudoviricetes sp.]